jgi:WD40 repeat protein
VPREHCLSDDELRAYADGRLAEPELEEAAAHLDQCPRCEAAARRFDGQGSTLVDALRGMDDVDDVLPRYIGDYEVLGRLGQGGMGVVYRARQRGLGRVVALKMLRGADNVGPDARRRFRAEAAAVARLQHPHIVQVFEVGEHTTGTGPPQPYFTLEYVDGGNLADRLANRPQPPLQAAAWLEAIASAVHHAHQAGVVHRDLKPSNVLLTADGAVKVCDFGVAKMLAGSDGRTCTGALLGTPEYMSPEQAQARDEVGPAADVYALGAILYDMLTGRPPFRGASTVETLLLVQTVDAIPPRRLQPGVPRDLETICLKCLEKSPHQRYRTAQELVDDLRRFQTGAPVRARPLSAAGRAWRWCRRHPALAAALLFAVVALLGGTATSWWFAIRAGEEAEQARASARRASERAYLSDLRLVQTAWDDALSDQVIELLDAQRPAHVSGLELRGFEWHYWWRLSHWERQVLRQPASVYGVACSDDRVAGAGSDGTVRIWDNHGNLQLTLMGHEKAVYAVAFGPQGDQLASAGADGTVRVWDARRGGAHLLKLEGNKHHARGIAFSPNGERVASAGRDGTVRVWDARHGGEVLFTFEDAAKHPVFGVAFDPDSRRIASAGADKLVKLWAIDGTGTVVTLSGATDELHAVAFSPDGTRVAAAGTDGKVRVWDAAGGAPLMVLEGHADQVWGLAYSPGGDRLVSAGADRTVAVWDAVKLGPPLFRLVGHGVTIWHVAYAPDGKRLASAGQDGTVRVWDADRAGAPVPWVGHKSQVTAVALSPDGRRVASAGGDWDPVAIRYIHGELKLWDADTGRIVHDLKDHADGVTAVAFSSDGQRLASASGVWDERAHRYAAGEIKLWDASTGDVQATSRRHAGAVLSLAFSPDGQLLASAGMDGVVHVRRVPDGDNVLTLEGHTQAVTSVAFSPDGQWLVSAGFDGEARVWDVRTGTTQRSWPTRAIVSGAAISKDGRRLALAGYGGWLTVWDPLMGERLLTLKGHTAGVTSVAFSPDGTRLVASGEDGTVRVWEAKSGQEVLVLKGHARIVRGVAFSRDGTRIVSGGWDRTVRLWDARPRDAESTAHAVE